MQICKPFFFWFTRLLFFFLPNQEPSKSIQLDKLGQKLMDKIGSSWSQMFRKQYGPIGKVCPLSCSLFLACNRVSSFCCLTMVYFLWLQFLQFHSEIFMLVANGTRVVLKANPPSPGTDSPDPSEHMAQSDPSSPSDPGPTEPQQSKQEVGGFLGEPVMSSRVKIKP